jgi:hypothetical protein
MKLQAQNQERDGAVNGRVQLYTCKCGAEYIGKTERILHYGVKKTRETRLSVSDQKAPGHVNGEKVATSSQL